MEASSIFRFIMAMAKKPLAIIAVCFLFQLFLVGNFPNSSIGVGAKLVVEAFSLVATTVFLNVATLYATLLLIGTKRLTLERTADTLAFECIFDDARIGNQGGKKRIWASANECASPKTASSGSTTHSSSDGLHRRKRLAPTQIDECLDDLARKPVIETPFKMSGELSDTSHFAPSTFSPSILGSIFRSDGYTSAIHDLTSATPPSALGRKMMRSTSSVTIEIPPPGIVIGSIQSRSVKGRRSTPFRLARKRNLGKS
jgi:hypothetical protein